MLSKYFKSLENKKVLCTLCYRSCVIRENETGFCKVRKNIDGKLFSLVYNKPISINIDQIEKKPLYHFLPKTKTLSLGTNGCNFNCAFCQNHTISDCKIIDFSKIKEFTSDDIITLALENNCPSISYTYTEPTVFGEYAFEIMKKAKKLGLKNIFVSNGYFSKDYLADILPYLDAINVDLKGTQEFYDTLIPGIQVKYIKENIKELHKHNIHLEITNLLIENYNTKEKDIEEIVDFIFSVSPKIPLHFSRSFPHYRLKHIIPTKLETLKLAEKIARDKGIENVYLGNI